MDPHIYPEQPGLPQDSSSDEDGANYLRRLKGATSNTGGDAVAQETAKLDAAMATLGLKERRGSPRIRCSGSVEFRTEGIDARMWGTLTDISLHGCYVEMSNTFPVDTKVNLVLKSCGIQIRAAGTVRASYPALGMGIRLSEVDPEQQLQLKKLLTLLAGHTSVSSRGPAREAPEQEEQVMKSALELADPRALFDGLQEFFRKSKLLSWDEFHQIAKRARRG